MAVSSPASKMVHKRPYILLCEVSAWVPKSVDVETPKEHLKPNAVLENRPNRLVSLSQNLAVEHGSDLHE